MKVTKEKLENSQVLLKIEAEPQEAEAYLDKAYRRIVNRVLVPGFRKGKAPRFILERHIGKDALLKDAMEKMIPELYKKAIQEQEVDAIGEPDINLIKTDPVRFEAKVPVKPTVELADYKSIRIPLEPVEVKEEDLNKYLESIREQNALWQPMTRPVQLGDRLTMDLQGIIEGKKVLNEKGLQIPLLVEGGQVITPGFSDRIVGMTIGEEKEFELPFPAEYPRKELAGKACLFKVKINEIKEKKLLEMNDEFAKSLGWGVETMEALKTKTHSDLKQARENLNRRKHEFQVLEALVAASKVEYPTILVEQEIDRIIEERVRLSRLENLESYLTNIKKTSEELREEFREQAQKRIANTIVLDKVREQEKVEVTEEDIDKEIEKIVKVSASRNPEISQQLNTPSGRESIKNDIKQKKTLQLLSEIALSPETLVHEVKSPEHTLPPS